jgi:hypothetical protein
VSPPIVQISGLSQSELVGLFDVFDMTPELVAEHEAYGGLERVLKDCAASSGPHPWLATAPTNGTGTDLRLYYTSRRVVLDDGTVAALTSMRIVSDDEDLPPFRVTEL